MTFLEAINSGKKIKSQYWGDNLDNIDTTIFTDKLDPIIKNIIGQTATPLSWKEMLGEWYVV
jgi:hypothetical protein